jgi:hypothetical protein
VTTPLIIAFALMIYYHIIVLTKAVFSSSLVYTFKLSSIPLLFTVLFGSFVLTFTAYLERRISDLHYACIPAYLLFCFLFLIELLRVRR